MALKTALALGHKDLGATNARGIIACKFFVQYSNVDAYTVSGENK